MRAPLSYIGGKNRLAKRVISIFPKHTTYVEAFAGGAQVFFRKEPSKVEVLNDLDGEIVNFYRVCQQHYEELLRYLRFALVSREWFDLLKKTDPATLTDIQRAARPAYQRETPIRDRMAAVETVASRGWPFKRGGLEGGDALLPRGTLGTPGRARFWPRPIRGGGETGGRLLSKSSSPEGRGIEPFHFETRVMERKMGTRMWPGPQWWSGR